MIWHDRVFHDQEGYCVRVVLYERDGTLIGCHKEPAVPSGRTAEELAQDIEWFKQAFELPILTLEELESARSFCGYTSSLQRSTDPNLVCRPKRVCL
jgi:hypothetical protein